MQTRMLETLCRIYQVSSFTKAATQQNMTLSALSLQMRTLETDLGVALFDRSFRPPKLTALGRSIAEKAGQILAAETELRVLCGSATQLAGHFRFGFIPSAGVRYLPPFLRAVATQAPNAKIDVTTAQSETLAAQVVSGTLDAALITHVDHVTNTLQSDVLVTEKLVFGVPLEYADTPMKVLAQTLPFVHFLPTTGIGRLVARYLKDYVYPPQNLLVIDGMEACIECVKAGIGYTLLSRPDLLRYSDGKVAIRQDEAQSLERSIALVTRKDAISAQWRPLVLALLRQGVSEPETF